MKELQRKSLATAEFDEILGSHVYSVHDLQGFQIDVLWLHIYAHNPQRVKGWKCIALSEIRRIHLSRISTGELLYLTTFSINLSTFHLHAFFRLLQGLLGCQAPIL